jgi:hypothetical protein
MVVVTLFIKLGESLVSRRVHVLSTKVVNVLVDILPPLMHIGATTSIDIEGHQFLLLGKLLILIGENHGPNPPKSSSTITR